MSRRLNEEQGLLSGDSYSELDFTLFINDEDDKKNLVEAKENGNPINSEHETLTDDKDDQDTPNESETPAYIRDFLGSHFSNSQEESVILTGIILEYLDPADYIDHPLRHQPEDKRREPLSRIYAYASLMSFIYGVFIGTCTIPLYLERGRYDDGAWIISLVMGGLFCSLALICRIKSRRLRKEEELPSFAEVADTIYNFFRPVSLNRPHERNPIVATIAANPHYTPPTLGNLAL